MGHGRGVRAFLTRRSGWLARRRCHLPHQGISYSGVLDANNAVTRINRCQEVTGGSTGRKLLLDVTYRAPQPDLHTDLFVKFSRDFDDPVRDRGRTQMDSEVKFASLSLTSGFPIAVPHT